MERKENVEQLTLDGIGVNKNAPKEENIDYEQIHATAKKAVESSAVRGIPIIFPKASGSNAGFYKVKLFVNPSTPNVVWRKVVTHKFDEETFPCLTNYGLECEFCNVYKSRSNLVAENFLLLRKRYIIYGYLLETNVPDHSQFKDSIVILSYVEYLHNILMEEFSKSLEITKELLGKRGRPIIISNDPSIRFRYTLEISKEVVDISDKLNINIPSLLDAVVPAEISNEIINTVKRKTQDFIKYTDILIKAKTSNIPTAEKVVKSTNTKPDCFGKHNSFNVECLSCPVELECIEASKGK